MICPGMESSEVPPDGFVTVQFPQLAMSESMGPNNVFLAPVNFKADNAIVTTVAKQQFGSQPSTSSNKNKESNDLGSPMQAMQQQLKDSTRGSCHGKINRPEIIPTFRSGELTVSVKNTKIEDYNTPMSTTDFTKLAATPLTAEALSKMRTNLPPDFAMADLSQQITGFPDLSKLTSFSPADLAKLSGFSLSEFTKASSTAYARNMANLFGPLAKCPTKDITMMCNERINSKPNEFITNDLSMQATNYAALQQLGQTLETSRSEDLTMDRQKSSLIGEVTCELPKVTRPTTDFTTAEELSISSVRPDFGAMLDMSTSIKKQQQHQQQNPNDSGESLNLSKDRS